MLSVDARTWVAVLLKALISACGGDSSGPYLQTCDVRTPGCQAHIYASLAPLLEADPAELPKIRVIWRHLGGGSS